MAYKHSEITDVILGAFYDVYNYFGYLKAVNALLDEHEAQLLNYLRAKTYEVGLLLNFGPKPIHLRKAYDNNRKGAMKWQNQS